MGEMLATLVRFAVERESIRLKREAGQPAPWTEDPILAKYRFCNVRRRDDRVTRWLLKNYYPQFSDKTDDAWFAAAVARLINWPSTLQHLLTEAQVIPFKAMMFDPKKFAAALEAYKVAHDKTFTGAYMLYAGGRNPQFKGVKKSDFIAHMLVGLYENRMPIREAIASGSVRATVEAISSCFGLSTFMAGQVAADLTYDTMPLRWAVDLYTYAPQGPGSLQGLNRLHGRPLNKTWGQPEFDMALVEIMTAFSGAGLQDLTLHDVQNVMCEYGKYDKVMRGEGQPRAFYRPETAYEV